MISPTGVVELSAIDEERFGVRTAIVRSLACDDVDRVLQECRDEGVELLVARCPVSDLVTAQALERAGAGLMDTLVYYTRKLDLPIPADTGSTTIRPVRRDTDAPAVAAIAAEAFAGYTGHYHADPRLSQTACDAAYVSWAERSVLDPGVADEVLISEHDGRLVGFATLRINSPEEAEGVLFAVAPAAQGRGIYRSFMVRGLDWAVGTGAQTMVVSTQVQNVAVQKVWVRVGFEPAYAAYTFHKWFV